eukprot:804995-Rhodomonas_salina.2
MLAAMKTNARAKSSRAYLLREPFAEDLVHAYVLGVPMAEQEGKSRAVMNNTCQHSSSAKYSGSGRRFAQGGMEGGR